LYRPTALFVFLFLSLASEIQICKYVLENQIECILICQLTTTAMKTATMQSLVRTPPFKNLRSVHWAIENQFGPQAFAQRWDVCMLKLHTNVHVAETVFCLAKCVCVAMQSRSNSSPHWEIYRNIVISFQFYGGHHPTYECSKFSCFLLYFVCPLTAQNWKLPLSGDFLMPHTRTETMKTNTHVHSISDAKGAVCVFQQRNSHRWNLFRYKTHMYN